jgi:hypothetical protein
MLVSHRYKFIYLKAKKVAGTSIESYLERYCISMDEEAIYTTKHDADSKSDNHGIIGNRMSGKSDGIWYNHKTVPEIKKDLPTDVWGTYFKICNIRNPYDMMVSWYHSQTGNQGVNKNKFVDFLKDDFNQKLILKNKDIWSEDGQYNFNYIRFEYIEEDLFKIMNKLKLPKYDISIPKFKVSNRGEWKDYYNDNTMEIVYNMFKEEINYFNYKF